MTMTDKDTITEIKKSTLEGISSRLNHTGELILDLEDKHQQLPNLNRK